MDFGSRRGVTPRTGVVAGSVWDSRIKVDQVKGGIKVFKDCDETPEEENGENSIQPCKSMSSPKQGLVGISGKRKTWKTETSEGSDKNPIQIARRKSELRKNLDEQYKELSLSVDRLKKTPIQIARQKSEVSKNLDEQYKELSLSVDRIKNSPIQIARQMPELNKNLDDQCKELNISGDGIKKSPGQTTKTRSDFVDDSRNVIEGTAQEIKKSPIGITKTRSDENCKESSECEEKVITSKLGNVDQVKFPPKRQLTYEDDNNSGEEFWDGESGEEEIEIECEEKSFDVKEMYAPEQKAKKIVIEEKRILQSNLKSIPISAIVKKQAPPVVNYPRIVPKPTKTKPTPFADKVHTVPKTHNKLQSLVDLVMWKDVSKSAFIFGLGTFIIISSSYTTDFNISFITILSYIGLVSLAAIFLFRSIIFRGAIDVDDTSQEYVVGEEEAIWLLKLILPYINEFLSKIRAIFSGDPAITMKLAALLFVLARCGSSITIWKMAKLGFFGVFTVPKICSSYSSQLTAYGTSWIRRFRDAWDSCSHKNAVAFVVFTVVWNFSYIVARIWAVFMLFVGLRYYQQHSLKN